MARGNGLWTPPGQTSSGTVGAAIDAAGVAFKKALIEAALNAELSHHLGYPPGSDKPDQVTNHRNGSTTKMVLTGDGSVQIKTPRDREGSFEPLLLPKHACRFTAFDDNIVALYARGLTVREIQAYLIEIYATEVSPQLISTVTDGVLAEVTSWQSQPLEAVYAVQHSVGVCQAYPNAKVVFFDALRVNIRGDSVVRNKAVYLALGVRRDGTREPGQRRLAPGTFAASSHPTRAARNATACFNR